MSYVIVVMFSIFVWNILIIILVLWSDWYLRKNIKYEETKGSTDEEIV